MGKRAVSEPEPYEVSPELEAEIDQMMEEAERAAAEVRVNIRWRKVQLDVIKLAAARYGIPYQTYIKQMVFRQALQDLKEAEIVMSATKKRTRRA